MSDVENISVKIVILGEPAVGKTSLRLNFIGKGMGSSEEFLMTLGADLSQSTIKISDSITLDAQIWDIAGQENFTPIIGEYLQGAQGAILVYDMTRSYTFDKINDWLDKLHKENPDLDHNIPFIVLGNKADLDNFYDYDEEKVTTFIDYINRHNLYSKTKVEHLNTSAKTGYAVQQAFERLGRTIIRNFIDLGETIEGASELFDDVDKDIGTTPSPTSSQPAEEDRIIPPSERFKSNPQEQISDPASQQTTSKENTRSWGSGTVPSISLPKTSESKAPETTPAVSDQTQETKEEPEKPAFDPTPTYQAPVTPRDKTSDTEERLVRPSELLRRRREEREKREREEKERKQ